MSLIPKLNERERFKLVPKEIKDHVLGLYGQAPG